MVDPQKELDAMAETDKFVVRTTIAVAGAVVAGVVFLLIDGDSTWAASLAVVSFVVNLYVLREKKNAKQP